MNILIINTHEHYPFSEGRLSAAMADLAADVCQNQGYEVQRTNMQEEHNIETELQKHLWADVIILQIPVNWMSVPWPFKKYMDQVYTAGMQGQLCDGDGRSREIPDKQYGTGGKLQHTRYLMSLTFNAPKAAFDDPEQYLFQGHSVDDLMRPMHMNFRFFGMTGLPTFVCYDVIKNPDTDNDLNRYRIHLQEHLQVQIK